MKIKLFLFIFILTGLFACQEGSQYVLIKTEYGDMKVELYNSTPQHRDNFVKLVKEGFYDDLLFHRVIQGFMIQGGDPLSKGAPMNKTLGVGGPGYTIPAEIGSPHFKGVLAAARLGGPTNPEKRSSGSQFYIVQGSPQPRSQVEAVAKGKNLSYNESQIEKYETLGGYPMLDGDYTVFGELVSGLDVIDKIAAVATNEADRPVKDVKMQIVMSGK